jgi:starch-binding outer membrane protein, SusD/RagB family
MIMKSQHKNYTLTTSLILAVLLVSGTTGCQKILDVKNPNYEVVLPVAFQDSISAVGAVTGIYAQMNYKNFFGLTDDLSRAADDIATTRIPDDFEKNTLTAASTGPWTLWQAAYYCLNQTNTCIDGLQSTTSLSQSNRSALLGECYFSRAFLYFYLVNLWGDATPLVLTTDLKTNMLASSTPTTKVYQQIITDLQLAESHLSLNYPSPGRVRPNRLAATALLARVYLFLKQYDDAATAAGEVINSGLYTPLPTPSTTFFKDSKEIIWSVIPGGATLGVNADALAWNPSYSFSPPSVVMRPELISAFEPDDQRWVNWTNTVTVVGKTYIWPFKYKNSLTSSPAAIANEYYVVLRAAEQYLIRAEANAQLGNVGAAVEDLNIIRKRARSTTVASSLPDYSSSISKEACLAAIEQERRVELFAEWGNRWLDLNRWPAINGGTGSRADQVLGKIKTAWNPIQKLFPVNTNELLYDPNLIQNPGY